MSNQLIKNETDVFYTVKVKEGLFVRRAEFAGSKVINLEISDNRNKSFVYNNRDTAAKVAIFASGKIIKHTRTQVITEVTEEIHILEGDENND